MNRNSYSKFRVVIYRINPEKIDDDIYTTLFLDPLDPRYVQSVEKYKGNAFKEILKKFYNNITNPVFNSGEEDPELVKNFYKNYNTGIQEIDITPFVFSVNSSISLEGVNSCSISCSNSLFLKLSLSDINRFISNSIWGEYLIGNHKKYLEILSSLVIREYDFIRVYSTNDSKNINDTINSLIKVYKEKYGKFDINSYDFKNFLEINLFKPVFTGVVKGVSVINSVDSVSSLELSCLGIMSVFGETSTVLDQSLINSVTINNEFVSKDISNEKQPIVGFANKYSGMRADEVFVDLINSFLKPKKLAVKDMPWKDIYGNNKNIIDNIVFGEPDINSIFDSISKDNIDFIQFFHFLYVYHMVKTRFKEKIFIISDFFDNAILMNSYLLMLKDQFQLYNSVYDSPINIISNIRNNCFLDIFEDRTGCIIMQVPKFIKKYSKFFITHNDIVSSTISLKDSSNLNTIGVLLSQPVISTLNFVPPTYFIDPISVFRFGMRVSQPIVNPNVRSFESAGLFSKFYRFYYLYKNSRSAAFSSVGWSPSCVGENIIFENKIFLNNTVSNKDYSTSILCGYINTVNDTLSVDQVPIQKYDVNFVQTGIEFNPEKFLVNDIEFIESNYWGKGSWDGEYVFIDDINTADYMNVNCYSYTPLNDVFKLYHPIQDKIGGIEENWDLSTTKKDSLKIKESNKSLLVQYLTEYIYLTYVLDILTRIRNFYNSFGYGAARLPIEHGLYASLINYNTAYNDIINDKDKNIYSEEEFSKLFLNINNFKDDSFYSLMLKNKSFFLNIEQYRKSDLLDISILNDKNNYAYNYMSKNLKYDKYNKISSFMKVCVLSDPFLRSIGYIDLHKNTCYDVVKYFYNNKNKYSENEISNILKDIEVQFLVIISETDRFVSSRRTQVFDNARDVYNKIISFLKKSEVPLELSFRRNDVEISTPTILNIQHLEP